jgi:peroxiredoxin
MALLRQLSSLRLGTAGCSIRSLASAAQAATASSGKYYDVPEGHINSDLSPTACNIGLNRRRDLTLGAAGEIKVAVGGQMQRLADLFRGHKTVLFGVPDCGKVCSEQHVPGYLKQAGELKKLGVTQVLCVAVSDPAKAQEWGAKVGANGQHVTIAADPNAALTRMLGMEAGDPKVPEGQRSQRYAIVLEDGIILKVGVDKSPAEVKASSAAQVIKVLKDMQL